MADPRIELNGLNGPLAPLCCDICCPPPYFSRFHHASGGGFLKQYSGGWPDRQDACHGPPLMKREAYLANNLTGSELQVACGQERTSAGAAGPHPASGEGKLELTEAPRSQDRGRENSRRLPLRTAVEGVPREARKREAACHLLAFRETNRAVAGIGHCPVPLQSSVLTSF